MTTDQAERFAPFYGITLEPVERPTIEQLRVVQALALHTGTNNYLELRAILTSGGFQCFGEMLSERVAEVSRKLADAGIPHHVDQTGIWKMRSPFVFERQGVTLILPASEVPRSPEK